MSRTRKSSFELNTTQQETIFLIINGLATRAARDGIIPVPALFINTKYAEARNILNKLLKILPDIFFLIREEKVAHVQEWKESFSSRDDELIDLEKQKDAAFKSIGELDAEFRKTKVELEEEKKRIREEKERVGGDQQRKATLILEKRTTNIGNLEAQHIELDGKVNTITSKAGCCGLSKKKKNEIVLLQNNIKKNEADIEKIKNMKNEEFEVFDKELDELNKRYDAAKEKLRKYVETFPIKIKEAKDKFDDIDVSYNQKENDYQVIRSRFDSYVSNQLMFSILQLHVIFEDFVNAVKRIESSNPKLIAFKEEIINYKPKLDSSFSVLWCPNSKDKNGDKLLAAVLLDPAKKILLLDTVKPADTVIQRIVPYEPGRILNRLKKGDLTGVSIRAGDVVPLLKTGPVSISTPSISVKIK